MNNVPVAAVNKPLNPFMEVLKALQLEPAKIWSHHLSKSYSEEFDDEAYDYLCECREEGCGDKVRVEYFHKEGDDCEGRYRSVSACECPNGKATHIGDEIIEHLEAHRNCHLGVMIFMDGYSMCFEFEPNEHAEHLRKLVDPRLRRSGEPVTFSDSEGREVEYEIQGWLDRG